VHEATVHQVAVQPPTAQQGMDLAAGLAGGALVLLVVLVVMVGVLIGRYRGECHQLRARNNQLSLENDRWHEDFAAQTGELSALRRTAGRTGGRRLPSHAEAS
jgi:hypothetical protein